MATPSRVLVLITGANTGIGLELTRQLLASKTPLYHILLSARNPTRGSQAVETLTAAPTPGTVEYIQLDVTDDKSIEAAAAIVTSKYGKLDILVNNAGVATFPKDLSVREQMQRSFDINATGPLIVSQAFLPLLKHSTLTSPKPRIVNVSSIAGSITQCVTRSAPMYTIRGAPYRAGKAAMNMVGAVVAKDADEVGVQVLSYCPGFTVSGLSEKNKAEFGAKGVEERVRDAEVEVEGSLKFLHSAGTYPW
ncbi:hypothetical protein B0J11DRAFT_517248 [Dendryphion nanum]|uniref:Short chain dehydrogenase n=1 Tax=Dendryphion nanum TaxID=256645 RepID=A0A9P9IYB7_9PLEO|nr:hypothetical protein B0J11DRAFT_517248 [Dendryphion nanum]